MGLPRMSSRMRPRLLAGLAAAVTRSMRPRQADAASSPSFVLIVVDDMRADMVDVLPRLTSLLSARGLTFTAAYNASPVCVPSRASLLRGQYPHNTGVLANDPPQGGYAAFRKNGKESSTVATWLKAAGYRTALIGKYMNDYKEAQKHVPAGWGRWFVFSGKGKYRSYRVSDQGKIREYGKKKKHYSTDMVARKAREFILTTPADQPFFLYVAPVAPHDPAIPAKRHKKAAAPIAPRLPSHNESDMSDKSGIWRNYAPMKDSQIKKADSFYAKQVKCMLAVENLVAEIIAALEAKNRLDETYIVFTADNGMHHGEHRIGYGKGTPFEESIRAPLIVVGPGVPPGVTSDAMVSLVDIGPTFAELANAAVPDFVDGRSIARLLDGSSPPGWRDAVMTEFPRAPRGGFIAIRQDSYVYVNYRNGESELYDLSVDPYQLDNIAGSAPQALVDELQSRTDAFATCGSGGSPTCQQADGGA